MFSSANWTAWVMSLPLKNLMNLPSAGEVLKSGSSESSVSAISTAAPTAEWLMSMSSSRWASGTAIFS